MQCKTDLFDSPQCRNSSMQEGLQSFLRIYADEEKKEELCSQKYYEETFITREMTNINPFIIEIYFYSLLVSNENYTGFQCNISLSGAPPTKSPVTTTVTPSPPAPCSCGKKNPAWKVVAGVILTSRNEFPWHALLKAPDGFPICGGSLIHNDWVLTTARCVNGKSPGDFVVALGEHEHKHRSIAILLFNVSQIVVHPKYHPRGAFEDYNVALVRLSESVTYNEAMSPVCLPYSFEDLPEGSILTEVWGFTTPMDPMDPDIALSDVNVSYISSSDCRSTPFGYDYVIPGDNITDRMICAGYVERTYNCPGDQTESGGPVLYHDSKSNSSVQMGIVTWDKSEHMCAVRDSPAVFGKVSAFLSWIHATTNLNDEFCRV